MVNVLQAIVEHRRETLANSPDVSGLSPSTKSFYDALKQPHFGFIMECKMASPSKGLIREDFNLEEIVPIYNQYADAISVLTEDRFFRGSYANLQYVSEHTDKPVLCKDFILEPKQVRQARFYGADAILLMLSVLNDQEYTACQKEAEKYSLDILTEVHNEEELERALALEANIIGINNRNLKDLSIDLTHTERLVAAIPSDTIVVTESGIATHDDVLTLSPLADACLVGSSLMSQNDLELAAKQLVYGDIKVCGVKDQPSADILSELPVSSLGKIFVDASPRRVVEAGFTSNNPTIGVFQNHSIEDVNDSVIQHQLSGVQLHGDESTEYVETLRKKLPSSCLISKVISIREGGSLPVIPEYSVDEILLDTQVGSLKGGTGKPFDWSIITELKKQYPQFKFRVAGGVTPDNIRQLKSFGICAVDVCGGTEASPGVKSQERIEKLFANARALSGRSHLGDTPRNDQRG
ncbi:bifunctional indole-3-glycerol-phosphate synthase TrpC/phosphoribosylanthranilate isomerase TrpF [Kangiella geojedonensis]|uniref:Multifunctional fusion protein n=1 Tax=Kangiella geojedonensis TaxID=914150 RepID=A0A0F6RCR8_9GAMM|nr:bifunctional indole-3-glycerol-phosphate synthase TrpC/phosphoribosylanthranilate isomerase TrpF [Kangiella geojedonensis]AKE52276.1 Indole-3-glycerol-phosphate synthase, Phosphoribosylanthranilate isomerase [Kangiella geojedonensis]